ncbi:glycosyltransferase family 2 protein [Leptolyngbya sp. FACHB-261]|uniref:glycosyltransferase family 2 protein n=1 Tax=Leptolyngbya sp. FACHB-261 TaxID=2692806 RepID=UPI001689343E|nr:glycosyltransferase family 2 protein [Leptolyngbya sp. FACHB-261]MBD2101743.1 glycosyltransferase family 2 protein [Leptolyngbya sp. FACHB-261]
MIHRQLRTPVVFLIFNRADTTEKVFEAIRQAAPPMLLVVADGPRQDRLGEAERCAVTRAIIDRVDWDCKVLTNYSDINLGCRKRVSSGLAWAFEIVDEAIILEDDCLPHPTFFQFCDELLERYRYDQRVMSIAGTNFHFGNRKTEYSYYLSLYHDCWGWATWKRAWQYYDADMKLWPEMLRSNFLINKLRSSRAAKYWFEKFQLAYQNRVDSWFYRWLLSCWLQSGLSVVPSVNMVSNIGFGSEATHTVGGVSPFANMQTEAINFPLEHPSFILQNVEADNFTQSSRFYAERPGFLARLKTKVKKIF